MNLSQLENILQQYPSYRFNQAKEAVFLKLINSWAEATNLPVSLRQKLEAACPLEIKADVLEAKDKNSLKALLHFNRGGAVETVLMRHKDGRNTVCVSSQIGCPLNCDFCATGRLKFKRNLTAAEIVEQVLFFARLLKKENQRVSNIVFMGMGEPFLNYEQVLSAIKEMNSKDGLNIGARHISISTVGIIDGIKKLAQEKLQVNLAISVHAANNELRQQLMPVNKKYPLENILKATADYIKKTRRRVAIEYIMLRDINDSKEEALKLAKILKKYLNRLFFVNLISYNPSGKYKPSTSLKIGEFKKVLERAGIETVQRYRFASDIKGACGQLAAKVVK